MLGGLDLNRFWRAADHERLAAENRRYHDRPVTSPAEARNALLYVLNNSRRHAAQGGVKLAPRWVDPYSSARQFDGWRQPVRREPGVTLAPATWLLRVGWRRRGQLDAHAVPGG